MAVRYCPLHGIGYNPALDPVCPQCSLARMQPPKPLEVDLNPGSVGYGRPIQEGATTGDVSLPKLAG